MSVMPAPTLHRSRWSRLRRALRAMSKTAAVLAPLALTGCAALHPIHGVDVEEIPYEYRMPERTGQHSIDLSLLGQTPPKEYLVDSGDVLGVYVEGILGQVDEIPPVYTPNEAGVAPALGFPVRVGRDGTIALPLVEPIDVRGKSIREVDAAIRRAYEEGDDQLLQPGQNRILVTLQRPRAHRIVVIRQESGQTQANPNTLQETVAQFSKKGTGEVVMLPAYQNDVLHAIATTGGLPGLDAQNVIYVIRRRGFDPTAAATGGAAPIQTVPTVPPPTEYSDGEKSSAKLDLWPRRIRQRPFTEFRLVSNDGGIGGGHSIMQFADPEEWDLGPLAENEDASDTEPKSIDPERPSDAEATVEAEQPAETETPGDEEMPHEVPIGDLVPMADGQLPAEGQSWEVSGEVLADLTVCGPHVLRIPLRIYPGEQPHFSEQDIILQDGDIVFIESRETEFFYTGGLLGPGQYVLPRDYDLDLIGAVALAERQMISRQIPTRSLGGVSALNQDVTVGASKVIIQRTLYDGRRVPIEVDLYDALEDPEHQIYVRPGDRLILSYTPCEAMLAFFERQFLEGIVNGASQNIGDSNN